MNSTQNVSAIDEFKEIEKNISLITPTVLQPENITTPVAYYKKLLEYMKILDDEIALRLRKVSKSNLEIYAKFNFHDLTLPIAQAFNNVGIAFSNQSTKYSGLHLRCYEIAFVILEIYCHKDAQAYCYCLPQFVDLAGHFFKTKNRDKLIQL